MAAMDGYIGLGANLGDRRRNLEIGLEGLDRHGLSPRAVSSIWETEPVGTPEPRWFWNMAVEVETNRDPLELLETLLEIERAAGRVRGERNAPRTLDLDLLLIGDLILDDPRLRVPHPAMWNRRFVLEPLAEIAPEVRNPIDGRTVDQTRRALTDCPVVRRLGHLASDGTLLI